jgi:hypothetical protein
VNAASQEGELDRLARILPLMSVSQLVVMGQVQALLLAVRTATAASQANREDRQKFFMICCLKGFRCFPLFLHGIASEPRRKRQLAVASFMPQAMKKELHWKKLRKSFCLNCLQTFYMLINIFTKTCSCPKV